MMKMRTALARNPDGNLVTMRYDDYTSNKAFADDLRGNGYRVLKVWASHKTPEEVEEWEFLNRK